MANKYKKIAMCISFLLVFAWCMMGTGTSLAWFADTDEEVNNIFHFAQFDLEVEYRDEDGNWKTLEGSTEVFDKEALYEPGYTQIVYLKIMNKGDVPFDFKTAVSVLDYNRLNNVFGQPLILQDHLKFGFASASSEDAMDVLVANRELAAAYATNKLSNYATDPVDLGAGKTVYMALVVRMPEEVDNAANYWGDIHPYVELGIIVTATQKEMPKN